MHGDLSVSNEPEALDMYEAEHLFHSWSFQKNQSPPRVVSAKGVHFTTEDGKEWLDFSSCFVSHNLGHQDPRMIEAIQKQAEALCSFAPSFSTKPRAQLARLLAEITPGNLSRSFITLGGTEANEASIKICHQYTGKRKLITRYRAYHGGTAASMTLSPGDARNWAQVQGGSEVIKVPLPYCYRCSFGHSYPGCSLECAKYIDEVIALEGGTEQVAGMILEPITGANGVIVPPPEYLPMVREICNKWGILLIADEVMTGFGRTGEWFAVDNWGVTPDIMSVAKGLSGAALPLGASIVSKPIGDYFHDHFFSHGATYAGHALGCAAAVQAIQIYQTDGLLERAKTMGKYLLDKALALQEKHPCVGDVRGLGLFVGLELVKNKKTREPIITVDARIKPGLNAKQAIAGKLAEKGVIAMAANPGNVIALAPALVVSQEDIDWGVSQIDSALEIGDAFCV